MKEIGKNFNKILWEVLHKMIATTSLLFLGTVFGVAFTLAALGITPQIFSEILSEYNTAHIWMAFMLLSALVAEFWQFATMYSDTITDDVAAV